LKYEKVSLSETDTVENQTSGLVNYNRVFVMTEFHCN